VGSTLPLPTGVITAGGTAILAEVRYSYTPPTAYVITGAIQMGSQFFSRPRRVASITRV
jgi:hypothetical protein